MSFKIKLKRREQDNTITSRPIFILVEILGSNEKGIKSTQKKEKKHTAAGDKERMFKDL